MRPDPLPSTGSAWPGGSGRFWLRLNIALAACAAASLLLLVLIGMGGL